MLIGASSVEEAETMIKDLGTLFEITDNKELQFHLECTIKRWRLKRTIKLHQQKYVTSILHDFNMEYCNTVQTLMDPGM
jgi:hypothetical protein